ncbi:MAG: SGNH/GDSL hydrolase family protein [Ruminococcaceae bacterium]|nr:SGNH/GDSL hydrolase family protein [Oscillospiraceae bacterium]
MKKALQIAILLVSLLILALLVLNLTLDGVWVIQGLNGKDGQDGKDGVDGVDGIDGINGTNGINGTDGKSAYELACENGFRGTLHEWLLSLAVRGSDGANGKPGADGVGVKDVKINAEGYLIVYLTDGSSVTAGYVGGDGFVSDEPDEDGFYPVYETVVLENVEQSLNLRLTPDTTNGEIFKSIARGTELLRVGDQKTEDGFSRFLCEGTYCYARSKFFELKYIYEGSVPTLNLPKHTVLTKGETRWFYTAQICPTLPDGMSLSYSYSGTGERVYDGDDAFALTPSSIGTATLTVRIQAYLDGDLRTIGEERINVTVVDSAASLSLTGMFLGDSRISDGTMVTTMESKMPNLTLIGTRSVKSSGVLHEGRGAWSTAHYLGNASLTVGGTVVPNAFYNPNTQAFDFSYYVQKNPAAAGLDFIVIHLGANDSFSRDSVENIDRMIDSIHAYSKDIRVLVLTEYVSPANGYALKQSTNFNVTAMRIRQTRYFSYLRETFEERESEKIYLIPVHLSINAWGDWTRAVVDTADGTAERITDVIHLGYAGYNKEAAVIRSYLYWLFGT